MKTGMFSSPEEAVEKARHLFANDPTLEWIIGEGEATVGGVYWEGTRGQLLFHKSGGAVWVGGKTVEDAQEYILDPVGYQARKAAEKSAAEAEAAARREAERIAEITREEEATTAGYSAMAEIGITREAFLAHATACGVRPDDARQLRQRAGWFGKMAAEFAEFAQLLPSGGIERVNGLSRWSRNFELNSDLAKVALDLRHKRIGFAEFKEVCDRFEAGLLYK